MYKETDGQGYWTSTYNDVSVVSWFGKVVTLMKNNFWILGYVYKHTCIYMINGQHLWFLKLDHCKCDWDDW